MQMHRKKVKNSTKKTFALQKGLIVIYFLSLRRSKKSKRKFVRQLQPPGVSTCANGNNDRGLVESNVRFLW